jgi:predicted Zn-dependent peptidase
VNGDFLSEVEEKFGHIEDRASGEMQRADFLQTEPRVRLETRESDQAHLRLGVRGIPTDSPDRYAMQVLTAVLGGGMSSRLFIEVRERLGLAYYVFGYHQSYADTGTLFSQAGVDIDRIDQAVAIIVAEFRKMASERVPDDELRRCKNYLKGRMVLQLEDPKGLLMFGLRREALENRVAEIDEVLNGIETVTADDIQRVARQVMVDDGLNFGLVGPFDDEERFLNILQG